MTDKEQIKAIIKQYADKGERLYNESCGTKEDSQTIGYWDGYGDCANLLLRELDSMQEEPQVKESAKTQHVNKTCKENGNSLTQEPVSIDFEQELYKAFGQVKDFTLSMRIAKWFYDMGKNSQEPVSEDLKEEMNKMFPILGHTASTKLGFYDTARHFANWQKQQMMAKAVDVTVHSDAGGYPYIPQMELYDYGKDIPLAKEGDKYKVILIKE